MLRTRYLAVSIVLFNHISTSFLAMSQLALVDCGLKIYHCTNLIATLLVLDVNLQLVRPVPESPAQIVSAEPLDQSRYSTLR